MGLPVPQSGVTLFSDSGPINSETLVRVAELLREYADAIEDMQLLAEKAELYVGRDGQPLRGSVHCKVINLPYFAELRVSLDDSTLSMDARIEDAKRKP